MLVKSTPKGEIPKRDILENIFWTFVLDNLDQRCPTHSPLATCGEWPFKSGELKFF